MSTLITALLIGLISWGSMALFPALPWYTPFIIAFIGGALASHTRNLAFLAGLLGIGLFWGIAVARLHLGNDGLLTHQLAAMFTDTLGFNISSILLMVITAVLGGLLGGLAALSAKLILAPDRSEARYTSRNKRRGSYKLKLN